MPIEANSDMSLRCIICYNSDACLAAPIHTLSCGHTFGVHCLEKWRESRIPEAVSAGAAKRRGDLSCPLCRHQLSEANCAMLQGAAVMASAEGSLRQVAGLEDSEEDW